MRITFGIHRNKKVEDISEHELRGLLDWIERLDNPTPSQKKDYDRQAISIRKELAERESEEAEGLRNAGPMPNLAHMTGSTAKLLLGLFMIREDAGGDDPFPAAKITIRDLTGLSFRIITESFRELRDYRVLSTDSRGWHSLNLGSAESADWRVLGTFLRTITNRTTEETGESAESAHTWSGDSSVVDRRANIKAALRVLSPGDKSRKGNVIAWCMTRQDALLDQGVSLAEVMIVTRWARKSWETGEARFAPLLDLHYILEPARFAGYLAAAKSGPAQKNFSVMESDVEREEMHLELQEKMKRKGAKA